MKRVLIGGVAVLAALALGVAVFRPEIAGLAGWKAGSSGAAPSAAGPAAKGGGKGGGAGGGERQVTVITAEASEGDFPIERTSVGFLSSPTVVNINARVTSAVTEVAVKDGQTVKAGDLLFKLDDRALQAALQKDQAALAKDQAAEVSALADFNRDKDLLAKGAGTQQAYDQQMAALKGFQASVAADQAAIAADEVQLSYATITAPVAGRLGAVNTTVGNIVSASSNQGSSAATPLVTITQMAPLQVTFDLPESDLPMLQKAVEAGKADAVSLALPDGKDVVATGPLDFIDSSVDTTTGTIAARAAIANADGKLWPGQYVEVTVRFGTLSAVGVPTVAVQQGQKGAYVFVVGADGKAAMRPVTVALADGARTAIIAGLSAGDRVVVEGQGRLKDGTPVREQKADGDGSPSGGGAAKPVDGSRTAARDGAE